jgi:hypothetical protein
MNDQELNELRLKLYENLINSKDQKSKKHNKQLLNLIDYAINCKKALENITRESISHI